MRVLLVGSGGREHALAWKLASSPTLRELHAAPGNPGIAALGECHSVAADEIDGLVALARRLSVDLVVVGPEVPLVAGLADALHSVGVAVFGPSAAAARIEGSKAFAKEVLLAAGVATADLLGEPRPPCVVKLDGLAAGKGVFVCRTEDELAEALAAVRGREHLAEELLEGEEVSLFALVAGREVVPLAPARDYKRVGDGDSGPNTGGMGSLSPVPGLTDDGAETLADAVHRPVAELLADRGAPFTGLLYAGLMLTADGPRVLEFNCRFGDPETQSLLPRLDGDLLAALAAAATGELRGVELETTDDTAVTIVLAAGGYPERGDSGTPIDGVVDAEATGALVFHAGTALRDGALVTDGGRILGVTGLGPTLEAAREQAYGAAGLVHFDGCRYRSDVGAEVSVAG
ncbi:MAG: phosphoribosylamine--glycine ligase [Gaiellaceae bacterium]